MCQEGLKERTKKIEKISHLKSTIPFFETKNKQEKTLQFWKLIQHFFHTSPSNSQPSMTYPVNTFCDAAGHAGSFGSQHERTENPWGLCFLFLKKRETCQKLISFTFFLQRSQKRKKVAKKKTMNIHEPLRFNNKSCWNFESCTQFGWWLYPSIYLFTRIRVERRKSWVFKEKGFENKGGFYTHG